MKINIQSFRKFYNVIALDTALRGAALKLYLVLNALADLRTRQVTMFIKTLAENAGMSPRHVRRCLAVLIDLGLVERILRIEKRRRTGIMEIKNRNQKLDNTDEQNFSVRQSKNALQQDEFAFAVLVNVLEKNKTENFMIKSSTENKIFIRSLIIT